MGGELLGPERSSTVWTSAVDVLLQGLRVITKYVQAFLVHYRLLLIDTGDKRITVDG